MSNCIDIHQHRLEVPGSIFDIPKFEEWWEKQTEKDEDGHSTGFY
jgi:hypothetical protein